MWMIWVVPLKFLRMTFYDHKEQKKVLEEWIFFLNVIGKYI